MRGVGTLVFVLAVLVNYIVCPGYHRSAMEFTQKFLNAGDYPGAWIRVKDDGELTEVVGPMAVWMKGKYIVAWNLEETLRPVHSKDNTIIVRDRAVGENIPLTRDLARMLEITQFMTNYALRM